MVGLHRSFLDEINVAEDVSNVRESRALPDWVSFLRARRTNSLPISFRLNG